MTNPQYLIVHPDGHIADFAATADEAIDKSWWRDPAHLVISVSNARVTLQSSRADTILKFYRVARRRSEYGVPAVMPTAPQLERWVDAHVVPAAVAGTTGAKITAIKDFRADFELSLAAAKFFIDNVWGL